MLVPRKGYGRVGTVSKLSKEMAGLQAMSNEESSGAMSVSYHGSEFEGRVRVHCSISKHAPDI